jgi:hypothetical protein
MKIDDYLFEPCGYSMNGILRNESNDYGLVCYTKSFYISPALSHFYGTEYEIWAGFKPVGGTENFELGLLLLLRAIC